MGTCWRPTRPLTPAMPRRIGRALLVAWLLVLPASYLVWWLRETPQVPEGLASSSIPLFEGEFYAGSKGRLVWRELAPEDAGPSTPTVVLLHGSPGRGGDLEALAELLGTGAGKGQKGRTREKGAPRVKPGKSRRSGGTIICRRCRTISRWCDHPR